MRKGVPVNTDQVRTFLAIVAEGSFIDASRRLHVAQSTVSERIRQLEKGFGITLFIRGRSGVILTPAGKRLIPHARRWVSVVEEAYRDIHSDRQS